MRHFIILMALMLGSLGAMAARKAPFCPPEFKSNPNYQEYFKGDFNRTKYPVRLLKRFEHLIGEFEGQHCKNAMLKSSALIDGRSYSAVITSKDECDGGNTYGLILNKKKQVVAVISDQAVECLSEIN